jgi:hypothetical protein
MRARWYDTQTGQFTTRDSAFDQTDRAYSYGVDDPVNGQDPTGLNAESGPMADGCNASNMGACSKAWHTAKKDVQALLNQQYPGFNWDEFYSQVLEGAGEGAGVEAGGCYLSGVLAPFTGACAITGAVGGAIGGAISAVLGSNSFENGSYVVNTEISVLNIIYTDTYKFDDYLAPCMLSGSQAISVGCVEDTVIQQTPLFTSTQSLLAKIVGATQSRVAAGKLYDFLSKVKEGVSLDAAFLPAVPTSPVFSSVPSPETCS